jgi:hypothetical protein
LTSGALGARRWLTLEAIILSLVTMLHQVLVVIPARGLARNVVVGSEAGSSDNNGTSFSDCVYIGYRAGNMIGFNTGHRNTMIGASAGATAGTKRN